MGPNVSSSSSQCPSMARFPAQVEPLDPPHSSLSRGELLHSPIRGQGSQLRMAYLWRSSYEQEAGAQEGKEERVSERTKGG